MTQPVLPITGKTACGYCGTLLTLHAEADWRCGRCKPELDQIKTIDDWQWFMRRMSRRTNRRRTTTGGEA